MAPEPKTIVKSIDGKDVHFYLSSKGELLCPVEFKDKHVEQWPINRYLADIGVNALTSTEEGLLAAEYNLITGKIRTGAYADLEGRLETWTGQTAPPKEGFYIDARSQQLLVFDPTEPDPYMSLGKAIAQHDQNDSIHIVEGGKVTDIHSDPKGSQTKITPMEPAAPKRPGGALKERPITPGSQG